MTVRVRAEETRRSFSRNGTQSNGAPEEKLLVGCYGLHSFSYAEACYKVSRKFWNCARDTNVHVISQVLRVGSYRCVEVNVQSHARKTDDVCLCLCREGGRFVTTFEKVLYFRQNQVYNSVKIL